MQVCLIKRFEVFISHKKENKIKKKYFKYTIKFVLDLFEYLKILGYPKPLKLSALYTDQGSLENFKLIFDILRWLIDQYEPGTILLGSTDSEIDRTLLVRSAVEFLVIKAGIKLNPIRLYASSMAAAPELLKVVNLIMKRQTMQSNDSDAENEKQYRKLTEIDIDDKVLRVNFHIEENLNYNLKYFYLLIDNSQTTRTRAIV